jgi:hypothetical protein
MRAIVTSNNRDAVLEGDARHLNAQWYMKPADPREWLGPVFQSLKAPVLLSA